MAQQVRVTPEGWDGWVMYTSEDGYRYHWNHLTHESRWASDKPAKDDSVKVLGFIYWSNLTIKSVIPTVYI